MKTKLCIISLLLALGFSAQAALFFGGPFNNNGGAGADVIPDNSTIGLSDSEVVSGFATSLTSVMLSVTLQGGVATDLSGYLRLGNLTTSPDYNLTTTVQGQNLSGGSPVTFNVDVSSAFSGDNPNDTWTLFFADSVNGDQTTLNSWSLDIQPVPEPVNTALGIFGGVMGVLALWRQMWKFGKQKAEIGLGKS
jgi:hypothetical protein